MISFLSLSSREAILAGIWASVGSTLGKLTASSYAVNSYIIWTLLFGLMILVNTWGCRYYLLSLDAATNSASPTVISAASSYFLSGLLGVVFFDEGASIRWWVGMLLIIIGLSLIVRPRSNTVAALKQAD